MRNKKGSELFSKINSSDPFVFVGSIAAGVICAVALLGTSSSLPMAWDEGSAILRSAGISRWAGQLFHGGHVPGPMTEQGIAENWPYTVDFERWTSSARVATGPAEAAELPVIIAAEGHPAFYGIVIAMGRAVSDRWLEPLEAARFGPILLFALATGALCFRIWRDYSAAAAIGAVAALILLPRMFAHAHFASYDGPLTSCWLLAFVTFAPACDGRWGKILWGVVLGMTLSCKATGWIAPIPFVLWTLAYWDRRAAKALAIGLPLAAVTFFVLNPPLWHHPISGTIEFFQLNFSRAAGWNIPILFLGEVHHLGNPLPWYNTLFWTAVTVPLGTLMLAVIGLIDVLRHGRTRRIGVLLAANWIVLLIVRALPGVPPHDGVRLFLPSFAFLAALAGVGCGAVMSWAVRRWGKPTRIRLYAVALGLVFTGSATSLIWYAPQWLSYYNLAIGGLPGAKAAGMEPTYYWDGLDAATLDWLHRNTPPGERICIGAGSWENLALMQRWRMLRRDVDVRAQGTFRWYVLQHRPGGWDSPGREADRRLTERFQPAFRKTLRDDGMGSWRLDVPLVEVYCWDDYRKAGGQVAP